MKNLLSELEAWFAQGEQVAMATVIRVIGSAPRPPGARMIASSGGRMAGSVSGGCVETSVYEEMLEVLAGGAPRILRFGIPEDMIWDVGLACGGTIEVLVEPLDPALVEAFRSHVNRGEPVAIVSAMGGKTSSIHSALVTRAGLDVGTADQQTVATAQGMLDTRSEAAIFQGIEPGAEIFIEPILPPPVLLILGAVHVGIPLTRFAKQLGFHVIVVDPREKLANRERFPDADEVIVAWPDDALAHLPVDKSTSIVLLTHDPKIDEPALAAALKTDAAYVGAIGSRKTHAARFERMAKWDVTPQELGRVYAPIGLDLGGRTPEETALSIIAEVVAAKNGRRGGSLRGAVT